MLCLCFVFVFVFLVLPFFFLFFLLFLTFIAPTFARDARADGALPGAHVFDGRGRERHTRQDREHGSPPGKRARRVDHETHCGDDAARSSSCPCPSMWLFFSFSVCPFGGILCVLYVFFFNFCCLFRVVVGLFVCSFGFFFVVFVFCFVACRVVCFERLCLVFLFLFFTKDFVFCTRYVVPGIYCFSVCFFIFSCFVVVVVVAVICWSGAQCGEGRRAGEGTLRQDYQEREGAGAELGNSREKGTVPYSHFFFKTLYTRVFILFGVRSIDEIIQITTAVHVSDQTSRVRSGRDG